MTHDDAHSDAALDPARAALLGAGSALTGLAVAELLGLVLPGRPSPVATVADAVISGMPAGPREALISVVGTLDKPLLVLGVALGVVLAGAVLGLVCASRPSRAPWVFGAGGLVALVLVLPTSSDARFGLTVQVAAGTVAALLAWERLAVRPAAPPEAAGVDRRTVLRGAGVLAVASVVALAAATAVRRGSTAAVDKVRAGLRLPAPADAAAPVPAGATPAVPGLAPVVTASADFYRIDTALSLPEVDLAAWTLHVDGRVDRPLTLTYADLLARPAVERYVTLACVSNPVGGDLVGNARWQGVLLADLLDEAGVHPDADLVVGVSLDGFTAGFPRAVLADGRDAMVAYAMNGEPLPAEHGFPARLVVPGLYGYVSATKWLAEVRLSTLADDTPFWVGRGWSADGTVQAASRIDVPQPGGSVAAGEVVVAGRAWHQHRGVGGVEVSVDDGSWQPAELATPIGPDTWRLWTYRWSAAAGNHRLRVRMVDVDGTPQDGTEHPPFPGAAAGYHEVLVDVV